MASGFQQAGFSKLLTEVRERRAKAGKDSKSEVIVGYSAPYAVYVHERLDLKHPNGQAKFLETPIRTERAEMDAITRKALQGRKTLKEAHLLAAQYLLKKSQELVPVATGALKASGFVRAN
jgi:hypothetical protein